MCWNSWDFPFWAGWKRLNLNIITQKFWWSQQCLLFFLRNVCYQTLSCRKFLGGIQTDGHSNSAQIQRVVKVHSSQNCERGISVAGWKLVPLPVANPASLAAGSTEHCQHRFFFPFGLCPSDDFSRNQSCFHAMTSTEVWPRGLKHQHVLVVVHILFESAVFSIFQLCVSN